VAVGAHEDALPGLLAIASDGFAAGDREVEGLLRRIHVVEVQIDDAAVVTADTTRAAVLGHERALDLLMAPRDRFADAALAPNAPVAVTMKDRLAVTRALADEPCAVVGGRAAGVRDVWAVLRHEQMFAPEPDVTRCPRWDSNPESRR